MYLIFYEIQIMSVALIVDKTSYVFEFDITLDVKCNLTLRVLMSYTYGAPILDVSRSHTTTQHSR